MTAVLHLMAAAAEAPAMANPYIYTPVGDGSVLALCMLMFLLLVQTYIHRDWKFNMLIAMIITAMTAAASDIFYHMLLNDPLDHLQLLYSVRLLRHTTLAFLLYMNLSYLYVPFWITADTQRKYYWLSFFIIMTAIAADVCGTIFGYGFRVNTDGSVQYGFNVFVVVFIMFNCSIFYLILRHRGRVIKHVFAAVLSSNILTVVMVLLQQRFTQESYTSIAYCFPIICIIFIFHSNPFDLDTGAANDTYLFHALESAREHEKSLVIMSCMIPNFSRALLESKELRYEYYQFFRTHVRRGVLYRLESGRLVLTFPKTADIREDKNIQKMLDSFKENYTQFELDYKIIITETDPEIKNGLDYIRLIEEAENVLPVNTVHFIEQRDLERFYGSTYILSELEDIVRKKDLTDERVLVYCQPVFNINTGTYDTAEALMRLKLPKVGMVFPDQFIPLAEQTGHIHTLSLIILNKTCAAIRSLLERGYDIQRISVNFSTLDIRYDSFCNDVQQIIFHNQIPFTKVAIEITESRSEADFNIMKTKVLELQKLGIKFYLDDFGTGYSNFERIMEIPFDIIKFDRSMTIESAKNATSFYMVSTFANMFSQLHYAVLFEGIENETDEFNCVRMSAKYLQGYKYSKPIPIEELSNFLVARQSA